jgi:tRNA threonylcarbamoyladenosine biosynthesis protein TsaB
MKILALETSTEHCSVALRSDGATVERSARVGQEHSERLFPMIAEVLAEAGATFASLDAIAFGAGPGSFTGLRIACGVAQGIGFAADLPLVPVGTLAALAHGTGADSVVAAIDARMGEVYLAVYRRRADALEEALPAGVWHPERLPDLPPGRHTGCGSAFAVYGEDFRLRYGAAIPAAMPDAIVRAADVAALASIRFAASGGIPAHEAAPLYLRDKVALTVAERRAGVR